MKLDEHEINSTALRMIKDIVDSILDIDMAKFDPSTGEEAYLNDDAKKVIEALKLAIEALEKQIPKKPIRKKVVYTESLYCLFCPSCEKNVGAWSDMFKDGDMYNHLNRCICPYCGQAIDAEDII